MKINISFIMISLFIIVMLIISIRGILNSVKNIQTVQKSKSFRKTKGTITRLDLWYSIEKNKETDDTPLFEVVKTYEYQVNGQAYTNNKTQLFDNSLLKYYKPVSEATSYEKWILETDQYKKALTEITTSKQKTTPVFYDKNNPKISCLTIEITNRTITTLILHVILLVLAFIAIFFFLRKTTIFH